MADRDYHNELNDDDRDGRLPDNITRALHNAPLPCHTEPEPPRGEVLSAARAQLAQEAAPTPSRRRSLRLVWTAAAVCVIAVSALALVLWPGRLPHYVDPEAPVTANGAAWASVDGYVIELDVVYPRPEPGVSEEELADNPALLLIQALDEWKEAHGGDVESPAGVLLETTEIAGLQALTDLGERMAHSEFALRLLSADDVLLQDLLDTLDPLPGVRVARTEPERFYYNAKYPEIFTPERLVIVDGKEYRFPGEIEEPYLKTLTNILLLRTNGNVTYRAFFNLYNSKRAEHTLLDADIIREEIDADGNLVLTTYLKEWPEVKRPRTCNLNVDPAEATPDFDPRPGLLERMTERTAVMRDSLGLEEIDAGLDELVFEVIPRERWLATGSERITPEEAARSREMAETVSDTMEIWFQDHREIFSERDFERRHRRVRNINLGDAVIAVLVSAGYDDASLAEDIFRRVTAAVPAVPVSYTRCNDSQLPPMDFEGLAWLNHEDFWVSSECIMVNYDVLYRDDPGLEAGEHPLVQLSSEVEDWLEEQTYKSQPHIRYLDVVRGIPRRNQPDGAIHDHGLRLETLDFVITNADEELLDALTAFMADRPGVSAPQVRRETWSRFYGNSRHNRDLFPVRDVLVDGELYSYPAQFDPRVVTDLYYMMLRCDWHRDAGPGIDYHARGYRRDPGPHFLESPYNYGDIISLTRNADGQYVFTTVNNHWDFLSRQGDQFGAKLRIHVPAELANDPGFDPQAELEAKWEMSTGPDFGEAAAILELPRQHVTWLLVDPMELVDATAAEVDPGLVNASIRDWEALHAAYLDWFAEHPDLTKRPALFDLAHEKRSPAFGEAKLSYGVRLRTADDELVRELVDRLSAAAGGLAPEVITSPGMDLERSDISHVNW